MRNTDPNDLANSSNSGLTKRELFALEAMKAIETANIESEFNHHVLTPTEIANRAILMADRLIERLNSDKPLQKPEPAKKPGLFG